jgi:ubiquinone/menaquinone biosynthesis C-methylase UbiE
VRRLNDPALVRAEYEDESRFAARAVVWSASTGEDPRRVAFDAVAEVRPARVLEVGQGRGELAERIQRELGAELVAIDQSERMVALARDRGVDARFGDVQELPFEDRAFDCVVAAWMLYHVPDLDRGLAEIVRVLRPGGRLVAVTNTEFHLPELWGRFGERAVRIHEFNAENGEERLARHFARVERRIVEGTVTFADWRAARDYVAASITRRELADDFEPFDGELVCSRRIAIFVAEAAA